MKNIERRSSERKEYGTPITIYQMEAPERYYYGIIDNYGKGGMHIKTTGLIKEGTPVVVRLHNTEDVENGPEEYEEYFGNVTWAKELKDTDPEYRFGYGVSYEDAVSY
ncbi:MAG: PilZ domain-containing protein [Desulfobacteraceae bacterium]